MRAAQIADNCPMETSATGCLPHPQGIGADGLFRSAIAAALPNSAAVHMEELNGHQSTKSLASDIHKSGHDGLSVGLLRQEAARRFSGGPSRFSTIFCGRLQ
jgi:hypothetical protein